MASSYDVYEVMKFIEKADREEFYVLHLNSRSKVVGIELISIGTLTNSLIHPREVFKGAILNNSASVILVHNHPSGDTEPSRNDIAITNELINIGQLLQIEIRDHVIIGFNKYCSMVDCGLMSHSSIDCVGHVNDYFSKGRKNKREIKYTS